MEAIYVKAKRAGGQNKGYDRVGENRAGCRNGEGTSEGTAIQTSQMDAMPQGPEGLWTSGA